MKTLSILGSTGSVGTQTLDIVRAYPDAYHVVALSTQKQIDVLQQQINEFKPAVVAVADKTKARELESRVSIPVYAGMEGVTALASLSAADIVVNALVGSAGILPTYRALQQKKTVALANKEALVAAGSVIMQEAAWQGVAILPLDSEHNALFQCLKGEDQKTVSRLILTCSGGPFRAHTQEQLEHVTLQDALKHPTWKMGSKITIDSATLMNKGFEVIEAHWLYGVAYDKIEVVVHPQSIVHALVEFVDCSVLAQLSLPDMRVPIQYALTYPERQQYQGKHLNLAALKTLEFYDVNKNNFPCISYAYEAGQVGGTLPAVVNAANEVAVAAFLAEKISFQTIPRMIRHAMDKHSVINIPTLDDILAIDKEVKKEMQIIVDKKFYS